MLRTTLAVGPLLLSLSAACNAGPPPVTGTRFDERLRSDVVDADYVLRVRLPPGYDDAPARHYPLVLQLDPTFAGLEQLDVTAGYVSEYERTGEAPEAIVVGIDYDDPNDRFRDYTLDEGLNPAYDGEGADRFYRALHDEIVPHLDQTLRTRPEARFLVGHSMGGLFALYAAFRHDPAEPPLLAGVIANDPSYSQDLMTYETRHAERSDALPLRIYRAIALYNGPLQVLAHDWMTERLDERGYEGLVSEAEEFETDHGGVVEPGYASGLRFLLEGVR